MQKCRAYCTKEFTSEADRDLHEIEDHGAEPIDPEVPPIGTSPEMPCPGEEKCFAAYYGVTHLHNSKRDVHVIEQTDEGTEIPCPGPYACRRASRGQAHTHRQLRGVAPSPTGRIPMPLGVMFDVSARQVVGRPVIGREVVSNPDGTVTPIERIHTHLLEKLETILESRESIAIGGNTVIDQLVKWTELIDEAVNRELNKVNRRLDQIEGHLTGPGKAAPGIKSQQDDPNVDDETAVVILSAAAARVRKYMSGHFSEATIRGVIAAIRGGSDL